MQSVSVRKWLASYARAVAFIKVEYASGSSPDVNGQQAVENDSPTDATFGLGVVLHTAVELNEVTYEKLFYQRR